MADGRTDFPLPVGERLRIAREARRYSLEDVATHTRVPVRHLEAIERGEWDLLPAPTYSIGFAKSYAEVVGLDRQEIGDDLRVEMGGGRATAATETFQPADPARVPPRTLATIAVLVALLLLAGYGYYRTYALGDVQPQILDTSAAPAAGVAGKPGTPALAPTPAAAGPVIITATEDVWLRVSERGGATLSETILKAGQSYRVPDTAADPVLRTGRADLLRVTVGTTVAPPVGPPNKLIKDVSLKPAALLAPATATPASNAPAPNSSAPNPSAPVPRQP